MDAIRPEDVKKALADPELYPDIHRAIMARADALVKCFVRTHGSCELPEPADAIERAAQGIFYQTINGGGV